MNQKCPCNSITEQEPGKCQNCGKIYCSSCAKQPSMGCPSCGYTYWTPLPKY